MRSFTSSGGYRGSTLSSGTGAVTSRWGVYASLGAVPSSRRANFRVQLPLALVRLGMLTWIVPTWPSRRILSGGTLGSQLATERDAALPGATVRDVAARCGSDAALLPDALESTEGFAAL